MELVDYSIIIPVYFNEGTIAETFNRIFRKVITHRNVSCEVIFVDDGSRDDSFKEIIQLKEAFPELIKVVKFTRNFGQVQALMAGYSIAKGRCVVNISADLQDPPELVNQMLDYYFNEDFQVVIGTRASRDESWYRSITSRVFYHIVKRISFDNMPDAGFDIALISDGVKNLILANREANSFWQGQILWTGYDVKFVSYDRMERPVGESRWTFGKKLKYLIDGTMSYSYLPLRLISVMGFVISLLGFLYAIFIVAARIFGNIPFRGWAPIMVVILMLSGFQMLMLGIIGEYLWRALDQVRNRQPYVIEKVYD